MVTVDRAQSTRDRDNAVLRALPGPDGDQWATVPAVADVTGLSLRHVSAHLQALRAEGKVESTKDGRTVVWRKVAVAPPLTVRDVVTRRAKSRRGKSRGGPISNAYGPDGFVAAELAAQAGGAVDDHSALKAAYEAIEDAEPCVVPDHPAEKPEPRSGPLGAIISFLEAARPVSAAPAPPGRRVRTSGKPTPVYATWGRGELQAAILAHMQGLPDDVQATPYELAKALNSHVGAVGYGLNALCGKGNVRLTCAKPVRYSAV